MSIPDTGWSVAKDTGIKTCGCGSWKQHWLNHADVKWPSTCSLRSCKRRPVLGALVRNAFVSDVRIVPLCESCKELSGIFTLKLEASVPKAYQAECCRTETADVCQDRLEITA